ncbi:MULTISPECIES: SDR family oxidoreductase [unclassified Blastococcus]
MATIDQTPALSGRVAVVTGASSGIGAATARALLDAGAHVALLGRRAARLAATAQQVGAPQRVVAVPTDVADPLQLADALDVVHGCFGGVDLVVVGAGVMTGSPFEDGVPAEWGAMIDVNLRGLLHTAQTFSRDLFAAAAAGGSADLVLVGAIAGDITFPGYAVFSAVEAAVAQLARTLRAEYAPRGVRVRTVQPGLTDSELGSDISDEVTARAWEELKTRVPPIDAADVASAVVFGAAMPAHVNVADVVVLPTLQDRYLPTRKDGALA